MAWPMSQDYNEAIQSPAANFADPDLRCGQVVTDVLGLPRPYSGNFADVYEVRCPNGGRWAVKCFTREVPGLRERYLEISRHLRQTKLPFTVDFSYLEQGILVAGRWYPVLKMQWVEGLTLNQFVAQYADKPPMLEALLQIWGRMAKHLRAADVAHCDLQHGNVLLVPGASANSLALKLIDYDGMWVPALAQNKSGEVGHPSYQHPQRAREGTYNVDVDRFPVLLIATALRVLKVHGKALWGKYDNGDNLLFLQNDLETPDQSALFSDLLNLGDATDRRWVAKVIEAACRPLDQTPLLEEMPCAARPAPARPVPAPVSVAVSGAPPSTQADVFSDLDSATSGLSSRRTTGAKSGISGLVWVGAAGVAALLLALCGGVAGAIYLATRGSSDQVAQGSTPAQPRPSPTVTPTNPKVAPTKPDVKVDPDPNPKVDPDPKPDPKPTPVKSRMLEFDAFRIVGPFDNGTNDAGLDTEFPPEKEPEPEFKAIYQGKSGKVGWRTVKPDKLGYFDLRAFFAPNTDNIVSYLARDIESPADQEVTLLLGADDGCKLWVNEKLIHTNRDHLKATPAREAVVVKLNKGRNRILFKINNGAGEHGFYMTMLSEQRLTALPVLKPPVPEESLLVFADKKAKRDHQVEYTKRRPEEIQAFANLLLKEGIDRANQPADRFVSLREARDLAAKIGDLPLALRAAEELANDFAVDAGEMKAVALERASGAAATAVAHANVVGFALAVAEEAAEEDEYEMAERFVKTAQASATKTGQPLLTGSAQWRAKDFAALRQAYEPVAAAVNTLAIKADDPDANLVVGKFYALAKGDWDRGLPPLKLGSDAKLKALAESDLAVPAEAEAAEGLGDQYATQAGSESGTPKTHLLERACYWYAQAESLYPGMARTNKVRKKRAEIERTLPAARPVTLFAQYGANYSWTDVTTNIRCLIATAVGQKMVARAESVGLGIDPAPNQHKSLIVVYRYRGAVHLSITGQTDATVIPPPGFIDPAPGRPGAGQELAILYANYGNEGTYGNAVAKLQAAVKGATVAANPNLLGLPDPFSGRQKAFVIVYRYGGRVRLSITGEGETTNLGAGVTKP